MPLPQVLSHRSSSPHVLARPHHSTLYVAGLSEEAVQDLRAAHSARQQEQKQGPEECALHSRPRSMNNLMAALASANTSKEMPVPAPPPVAQATREQGYSLGAPELLQQQVIQEKGEVAQQQRVPCGPGGPLLCVPWLEAPWGPACGALQLVLALATPMRLCTHARTGPPRHGCGHPDERARRSARA